MAYSTRAAKNVSRTISRRYYKNRLFKITTSVNHLVNRSAYSDRRNRYVKLYERRAAVGDPWVLVNHAVMEGFLP